MITMSGEKRMPKVTARGDFEASIRHIIDYTPPGILLNWADVEDDWYEDRIPDVEAGLFRAEHGDEAPYGPVLYGNDLFIALFEERTPFEFFEIEDGMGSFRLHIEGHQVSDDTIEQIRDILDECAAKVCFIPQEETANAT
jgi:hypothetical protein